MKQVIQNFKTGELYVDDVPLPSVGEGMVLIKNSYSLISSGTERGTVSVAKSGLLGKARQRPDLVAQVLQNMKKEGITATIKKVKTKLDTLKALGYSSAGTVVVSLDDNGAFKPGDRVACAGQDYASHAGYVAVPQNLVVTIPEDVSFKEAAFSTVGAIAIQGIRQAEPRLGEKVCVIGLGLLGQITCQLLKANGCAVFGIDLNDELVKIAEQSGVDMAMPRGDNNLLSACNGFTKGMGFDAVIITAATASNDPIELSAELTRKKGRVVVVGAVKMDVPRDPHFYRKELELRMSCSYGPGRYDPEYEEKGQDYPYAYVRWTEQRNMESFLGLVSNKKIDISRLISHVFDIDEAVSAYKIVTGEKKEFHLGILLEYDSEKEKEEGKVIKVNNSPVRKINVGFIGAGSFAQSYLIPNVKSAGASLDSVVTSKGISAKNVAEKFGFNFCSSDPEEILDKSEINTVFIATPHNLHAELVIRSLEAGKKIFVEKPLAINREQLENVINAYSENSGMLMVGFNRRYAPVSSVIKHAFEGIGEPMVVTVRVNAGNIPKEHWIQRPEIGGGRIVGEVCHFVDLIQYITDSEPVSVYAESIHAHNDKMIDEDNIAITLKMKDGSLGNIMYVANGNNRLPKELIEVYGAGIIGRIDDFKEGVIYREGSKKTIKSKGKGHKEEIEIFFNCIEKGNESPVNFRSIVLTTLTTIKIKESLITGLPQKIEL